MGRIRITPTIYPCLGKKRKIGLEYVGMIYCKVSLKKTLQKVLWFLKEKHNFLVAQRKKASGNKWNDTTFRKFKGKNEHFLAITQK
jgi:hypothetical protein